MLRPKICIYKKGLKPVISAKKRPIDDGNEGFNTLNFGIGGRQRYLLRKVILLEAVKSIAAFGLSEILWSVYHRDLCAEMIDILERDYGSMGGGDYGWFLSAK